jgi:DNA-directed RNA polymerase subunit RPC12/RpoP
MMPITIKVLSADELRERRELEEARGIYRCTDCGPRLPVSSGLAYQPWDCRVCADREREEVAR